MPLGFGLPHHPALVGSTPNTLTVATRSQVTSSRGLSDFVWSGAVSLPSLMGLASALPSNSPGMNTTRERAQSDRDFNLDLEHFRGDPIGNEIGPNGIR